jgi:hypothetical protein
LYNVQKQLKCNVIQREFSADLQNVSCLSLDESIGKIEVDPKEQASVVEVFQDVKKLRRIGVETRLKGYKYFEIERDFFNKLGVLIDGDFKFGVLLLTETSPQIYKMFPF